MPNRLRYRLHATPDLARDLGNEPEPTGALTERETLSRNPLPALPAFLAGLPAPRCVLASDARDAIAAHAHDTTGIDVRSACRESSVNRSCVAGADKMTQKGLED